MTKEATPQPWYTKPIQVPLFVFLMGGLSVGGSGEVAKRVFGGSNDTVDSVARESVEVVERRISRVERTLDSVVFVQSLQLELLKSIRRDQMRGHQGAEE